MKGLWTVLNPKEWLPSMRLDVGDEIRDRWFKEKEPESDDADKETESDGSQ